MIIERAGKHAETQEERAKRLYQVGNVVDSCGYLYLIANAGNEYTLYSVKQGDQKFFAYPTLSDLANHCYDPSDKLVTKITYETED